MSTDNEFTALAEELREFTAFRYAGDCKCGTCQLVPRETLDRTLEALRFAATQPDAGAVKVKPLEWSEYTDERGDPDRWDVETLCGTFYGIALLIDGFSVEHDYTAVAKGLDTLEAAKAAAQADYEQRILAAIDAIEPPAKADDDIDTCIACNIPLVDGDMVYSDASGGCIHAACCGPERESYCGNDGGPLKDDEPIPTPWRWTRDLLPAETVPAKAAGGVCAENVARALIESERQRQVDDEGYSAAHDDAHDDGELRLAAMCYLNHARIGDYTVRAAGTKPISWPWDAQSWKPTNPQRDFVKSGALLLAERERLLRLSRYHGHIDHKIDLVVRLLAALARDDGAEGPTNAFEESQAKATEGKAGMAALAYRDAAAAKSSIETSIRADEREKCAKVAEQFGQPYALNTNTGAMMFRAEVAKIAAAIRSPKGD